MPSPEGTSGNSRPTHRRVREFRNRHVRRRARCALYAAQVRHRRARARRCALEHRSAYRIAARQGDCIGTTRRETSLEDPKPHPRSSALGRCHCSCYRFLRHCPRSVGDRLLGHRHGEPSIPAHNATVTITGNITCSSGDPSGATMTATFNYATSTSTCQGTVQNGAASCPKDISGATYGYTVRVVWFSLTRMASWP